MQVERTSFSAMVMDHWDLPSGEKRSEVIVYLETGVSGGRVSNAWVTCPEVRNNSSKGELIPHMIQHSFVG